MKWFLLISGIANYFSGIAIQSPHMDARRISGAIMFVGFAIVHAIEERERC